MLIKEFINLINSNIYKLEGARINLHGLGPSGLVPNGKPPKTKPHQLKPQSHTTPTPIPTPNHPGARAPTPGLRPA